MSQPSYDLIKAIHHIWIIRQQHGSHDQRPSLRTHTLTHQHSYFYTNMLKPENQERGTHHRLRLSAVSLCTLRTIAAETCLRHDQSRMELGAVLAGQPELGFSAA